MKNSKALTAIPLLALAFGVSANVTWAAKPIGPSPNSALYGKSLTEWLGVYTQWYMAGYYPEQSLVQGVQILPLIPTEVPTGAGTREDPLILAGRAVAREGFTFAYGTPILHAPGFWTTWLYSPESGLSDMPLSREEALAATKLLEVSVNGRIVINHSNKADFLVADTLLDPVIPTPDAPFSILGVRSYAGYCFLLPQLPLGANTIEVKARFEFPNDAFAWAGGEYIMEVRESWKVLIKPKVQQTRAAGRLPK